MSANIVSITYRVVSFKVHLTPILVPILNKSYYILKNFCEEKNRFQSIPDFLFICFIREYRSHDRVYQPRGLGRVWRLPRNRSWWRHETYVHFLVLHGQAFEVFADKYTQVNIKIEDKDCIEMPTPRPWVDVTTQLDPFSFFARCWDDTGSSKAQFTELWDVIKNQELIEIDFFLHRNSLKYTNFYLKSEPK